jgi:glyoxylase-like metal-dependent hydrolase (beta-lactamase superfamily II)
VEPQADDLDSCFQFAESKRMNINHVIDTHLQAEHLSGGRALAEKAGLITAYTNQRAWASPSVLWWT